MEIEKIKYDFSICKLESLDSIDLSREFFFISKTDDEISLVCKTDDVPSCVTRVESGYKAFRFKGVLDFSLVGILSKVSSILADNGISIFALSTYNTDYVLVKSINYDLALSILKSAGYTIVD